MPVKGYRQTPEHRAAISASRKGWQPKRRSKLCEGCGTKFQGIPNQRFHSRNCYRAVLLRHGLIHHPDFAQFPAICAICGATTGLVGDHDHLTMRARGILCRKCNLGIGVMGDNPDRLRKAAEYLES